jgi:hypothetical protein
MGKEARTLGGASLAFEVAVMLWEGRATSITVSTSEWGCIVPSEGAMKTRFVTTSLGFAMLVSAAGCGSGKIGDYCDKKTSCRGGNDEDKAACQDDLKAQEAVADDYKCSDAWDNYMDCKLNNSSCQPNPGARSSYTSLTACSALSQALNACEDAATAYK